GLIPVRPAGVTGLVPVDGTTSANEWLGYIPFDSLPRVLNPDSGYIHSANEALVPLDYYTQLGNQLSDQFGADSNYVISTSWDYGYRGQRIVELLTSEAPFNVDKFKQIQADTKLISAVEITPYLQDLQFDDAAVTEARDWLLQWDYQMNMDSPQPVLYANFWGRLVNNLYNDELGDLGPSGRGSQEMWATRLLLDKADDAWWDDTVTADVTETRDDILKKSFEEAYASSVKALGSDKTKWTWGAIHTTTFVSNPLGGSGIAPIEDIVNRGPVATSGGTATVSAASWSKDDTTFEVGSGSSFRMIVDLNDLANSVDMHTTGQSGHPFSPYYDMMIDSWRKVQYKPMLWTDDQVNAAAKNTLTLKP
ncbi:MAG TPA: penicillin acylase family protein, partial [Phototrophicaceae bacterium]|nr:penicillin acylase family protein [Phototrophicaceae bacterium]